MAFCSRLSRSGLALTAGAASALLNEKLAFLTAQEDEAVKHYHILIVGGGSGGLGVAAQLRIKGENDIAVIEPSKVHYYQPLWTLVGGGVFRNTKSVRPEKDVIPSGVNWIQDKVVKFDPKSNTVKMISGKKASYDYLIVAAGLQINWDKIKGLKETIGKNGVVSIYDYEYCQDTWDALRNFKKGRMIFTQPAGQIKCGGAPQKIMWLADDHARHMGIRDQTEIYFILPQTQMFGVLKYSESLERLAQARGIQRLFGTELIEVDAENKGAIFKQADGSTLCMKYDLLHVVPPMSSPDFIAASPLANADGYVDVNKETLQSTKYPNIFSIGDCSSLPCSKTIAAITSQAPVLVHYLLCVKEGKPSTAKYDGYASCPLITGYSSVLLAEFKYGGIPAETFGNFLDQAEPRWAFMQMKKYVFPAAYWELFLRGRWFGPKGPIPPSFD